MTVIIDYGVGNLFSLVSSLKKIGEEAIVSSDKDIISQADRIILVDDAFVLLRIQPLQSMADQHAVDVGVDLGKVRGPERHDNAELGQVVA